jgi:hypothetical protein
MKTMTLAISMVAMAMGLAQTAQAGVGCDLNLRINNKTPNAITIFGDSRSGASKAGLNLWNPIDGLDDASIDGEGSGAGSHSKQAVELSLPCWTGKIDFRIKYLDGNVERWVYRRGVDVKSGDTVQINVQ